MAGYRSDVEEFDDVVEYGDLYDGVLIPCEFCMEQYPQDVIIEHETGCDLRDLNFGQAVPAHKIQDESERVQPINIIQPSMDVRHNRNMPAEIVPGKISNFASDESFRVIENSKVSNVEHQKNDLYKPLKYNMTPAVQTPIANKDRELATNTKSRDVEAAPPPLSKLDNFDAFSNCDTKDDDMDMKDIIVSDGEDDEVESIESLWKRAAAILKERLQVNDVVPAKNKYNNVNNQVKTNVDKNVQKKRHEWQW